MSSFLSRLKDAVGLKKPSKGHTLGSNPSSTSAKPGDGPSTDRAAQNVFSGDSEHSTTDSVFSLRFDTEVRACFEFRRVDAVIARESLGHG